MIKSIKHWPTQERPRERLLEHGGHVLSDAELLAIFLRTGYKEHSAVELARQLLHHFGGLRQILDAPNEDIINFKGMGQSKFSQLLASKELAQRYLKQQLKNEEQLNSSALIVDFLKVQLRSEKQELFAVLLLNQHCQFIEYKVLFRGTFSQCSVSTQEIVRFAIDKHAYHIIAVHNHPQGHALPSPEDLHFTEKLAEASKLLELHLADHFIINCNDYFSFTEQGILAP
ncbi:DNA repair protein RadC [Acinetobacter puyangensis]|uniref:DNA repair protein RadC n=1 Tax=Acinetobacter puyangensis TaxID=1096779 RepID=A0A240E7S9_9GAMM|nr:DNA repair protein RadC [Acinetobacter puyangensis]SNX44682.1 DNA repair protein RadC [Acinetobacter puyangensis]